MNINHIYSFQADIYSESTAATDPSQLQGLKWEEWNGDADETTDLKVTCS